MKITKEDFMELNKTICKTLNQYPDLRNAYKQLGYTDERLRWDVLHLSRYDTNKLYIYLNDSHIDTALRNIMDD